jgi:hypothetical protein
LSRSFAIRTRFVGCSSSAKSSIGRPIAGSEGHASTPCQHGRKAGAACPNRPDGATPPA